jgi:hypothetical protein
MINGGRGYSAVLLALVAGSAGALASCGFVVGVGDYVVGDAASDATADHATDVGSDRFDTGSGGDGADVTLGDAMRDAPGDTASERMDAQDAQSDRAPDSGVEDADTGTSDADGGSAEADAGVDCGQGIPTSLVDYQALVRTCVLAVSCDPYLFPVTLSDCITQNALQAANSFACISTITSCAGATNSFYSCEGVRFATTSECPGLTSSCDTVNQVAIDCNYSMITGVVTDCSRTPTTSCQIYQDSGTSSNAGCVVNDPCSLADGGGCTNNSIFDCVATSDGGVGIGRNCGNASCVSAAGGPICQFNGSVACADAGETSCNGSTLQKCETSGQAFNYDCTRAGGYCITNDAGISSCVSPGCGPSSSCTESCDSVTGTLSVCVGGAAYAIDCTQYGFSGCSNTGPIVYCSP